MKNVFLLSAILLGAGAFCSNAQDVVFDFSNTADLGQFKYSPLSLVELQTAKYINKKGEEKDRSYVSSANHVLILEGETITKDGVGITLSNPDKYKDYPRFFFGSFAKKYPADPKPSDFYCDLRWYQTEELMFNAPQGKKITKVVMSSTSEGCPDRACGSTMVKVLEGQKEPVGTQTINENKTLNTWEAGDDIVTVLTFKGEPDAPTQMAYRIAVTLADASGSAVNEINVESDAPAVYYNLNGVKQNAGSLVPGIYVMRQGSITKKVVVK